MLEGCHDVVIVDVGKNSHVRLLLLLLTKEERDIEGDLLTFEYTGLRLVEQVDVVPQDRVVGILGRLSQLVL